MQNPIKDFIVRKVIPFFGSPQGTKYDIDF